MNLLQVTGTLDPDYGGPPVVLTQLTRGLRDLGHHVDILTLDSPDEPWFDRGSDDVYALGPKLGNYGYSSRLMPWLMSHSRRYDAIVVHGVWQYQSLAVHSGTRVSGVPYFIFPHGALDPWFNRKYPLKHAKKLLYWPLAEYRVLRDSSAVLFMCQEELRLARQSFRPYQANEEVVGFGIEEPPAAASQQREIFLSEYPWLREKRLLLFLSRIHPKKGCDVLIRAFAAEDPHAEGFQLVMAGPDSSGWRHELMRLADSLGVSDRITWTGTLSGDAKWGAYRAAEAFVLPSHSENFGIVIPEALACGLPVLITNKVNIWREVVAAGAGFVADDTASGICSLLRRWRTLPPAEATLMRDRARACFEVDFALPQATTRFADCLERNARLIGRPQDVPLRS